MARLKGDIRKALDSHIKARDRKREDKKMKNASCNSRNPSPTITTNKLAIAIIKKPEQYAQPSG